MKSGFKLSRIFSAFLAVLLMFTCLYIPVSADNSTIKILSFPVTSIDSVSFIVGTSKNDVVSRLPTTLLANVEIYYDSTEVSKETDISPEYKQNYSIPVTWDCDDYNPELSGKYNFKAKIVESGYECPDTAYPTIVVELYEGKIEEKPVDIPDEELEEKPVDIPEEELEEKPVDIPDEEPEEEPIVEPPGKEPNPPENDTNPVEENTDGDSEKTPEVAPTPTSEEKPASEASANNSVNSGSSSQGSANKNSSSQSSSSSSTGSSQASSPVNSNTTTSNTTTSNAVTPSTPANNHATQNQNNTTVKEKSNTTTKKNTNSETSTEKSEKNDEEKTETVEESKEKKLEDITISVVNKSNNKTEVSVGNGKAVIDVKNEESSEISSIVTDEMTLLQNILTEEQLKKLAAGSMANIRISTNLVKESDLSEADANAIKEGVEKYKQSIPGLCIAGYVDIGIYLQMDDEDWSYVSKTNKPVELVINVPDSVKNISSDYYVLRLHDGKTEMFVDDDDNPDTITISSGKFSIYIVMYDSEAAAEIEKSEKKEMTTLVFVVSVLVIILLIQIIYIFFIRKRIRIIRN